MLRERERKGCTLFSALGVWSRRLYPILFIFVALRERESKREGEYDRVLKCETEKETERVRIIVEPLFGIARMVKVTLSYAILSC